MKGFAAAILFGVVLGGVDTAIVINAHGPLLVCLLCGSALSASGAAWCCCFALPATWFFDPVSTAARERNKRLDERTATFIRLGWSEVDARRLAEEELLAEAGANHEGATHMKPLPYFILAG